ncbi:MAG: hypothetical protein WKH64_15680 [Chloroflexia bacterium]
MLLEHGADLQVADLAEGRLAISSPLAGSTCPAAATPTLVTFAPFGSLPDGLLGDVRQSREQLFGAL